jgi:MFS family permease
MVSSFAAAVGAVLGPVLLGWLPRRVGYALLCLSSLAACAWLFRGEAVWGNLFLAKVGLTAFTTASFYGFFPLYFPELFPTRIRATGQGICYNAGRLVAAVGALLSGGLMDYLGGYAQMGAAITLIYLAGIVLSFVAPETKGKPLPA